ncbi:hypothetical protein HDU97_002283 [Phlyctochytrium planicorne]|nr:hypothetical protein HDU97_002283 [Phlyctochytrium planicorne]
MRLPTVLSLALLCCSGVSGVFGACTNPVVRREWNQLSEDEKGKYVAAVKALAKRPLSRQTSDPNTISLGDFVATHTASAYWAHANAQFFVYHRGMIAMFERALATVGWQGAVYFDWAAVSQDWRNSDVFRYLGTQSPNGNADANSLRNKDDVCLKDGAFAVGQYVVSQDPPTGPGQIRGYTVGNPQCLRRCGNTGSALVDATTLNSIYELATDYTSFRGDDSTNFHAIGHITMGGANCDMGNFYHSPNDPLFFLHHGMIDKIFWKWQNVCPQFKDDYEGFLIDNTDPSGRGSNVANKNQRLDSWPWTAGDMLNTQGDVLCYTYSTSGSDIPHGPNPACPKGSNTNNGSGNNNNNNNNNNGPNNNGNGATSGGTNPTSSATNDDPSSTSSANSPGKTNAANGNNNTISFGNQKVWFQDLLMGLMTIQGQTPLFARAEKNGYGEAVAPVVYNSEKVTSSEAPVAGSEYTVTSNAAALPGTTAPYGVATGSSDAIPTLPTTTKSYVASGTGSSIMATSTWNAEKAYYAPKAAPKELPNVYADKETNKTIVKMEGKEIRIPDGYKLYKCFRDVVVAIPEDFQHDPEKGPISSSGKGPIRLHPPRSDEEMKAAKTYRRPENWKPAPKDHDDLDNLRYPDEIPLEYITMMGMDPYKVRMGERNMRYAIDRCNNDPNCIPPSALRSTKKALEGKDLSFNAGLYVNGVGYLGKDGRSIEKKLEEAGGKKCKSKKPAY